MNNASHKIIGERLKSARMQLNLSRKEFANRCGFAAATLQAWEDGRYLIPLKSLLRYVHTLAECGLITTTSWFMNADGLPPRPAMSATNGLTVGSDAILKEINFFENEHTNPIIITVKEDAMLPFFEIGDYVGGTLIAGCDADKYIGTLCIIILVSGETLIRKLRPGTVAGCFNLVSTNIDTECSNAFLCNCEIHELAEIVWHRKIGL